MGLIRKMTSLTTMGLVDFKSDKERIANSTRKGMKAQKEMLAELRKANAANGVAASHLNRFGAIGDRQAAAVIRDSLATAADAQAAAPIAAPVLSPDGKFWWDGSGWQPMPEAPGQP